MLAIAVAAAAGLTVAPARAANHMEVGLQDDGVFTGQIGLKRKLGLKLAGELKVSRIRLNVPWASVVKSPGKRKKPKHVKYNLASYDLMRRMAVKKGMKLQVTLSGFAPAWATGNHKVGGHKIKVKYFEGFVKFIAKHFKGKVDRYTIWNEPNYVSWLGPLKSGAKKYRQMYKAARKIIHKISPKAKIFIGETAPYAQSKRATAPLKFIRDVVKGQHMKAEGYAHHPYDFRHSVDYKYPGKDNATIKTIGRLRSQLNKLAKKGQLSTSKGKSPPIYLTEYGYMASGKYKVSESKRAKYETKAFGMALKAKGVRQMTQYLLVKPPKRSLFFDTSIVSRKKGKKSKTFKALAKWAKKEAGKHHIVVPKPHAALLAVRPEQVVPA
jgi:hypothetical protein